MVYLGTDLFWWLLVFFCVFPSFLPPHSMVTSRQSETSESECLFPGFSPQNRSVFAPTYARVAQVLVMFVVHAKLLIRFPVACVPLLCPVCHVCKDEE